MFKDYNFEVDKFYHIRVDGITIECRFLNKEKNQYNQEFIRVINRTETLEYMIFLSDIKYIAKFLD